MRTLAQLQLGRKTFRIAQSFSPSMCGSDIDKILGCQNIVTPHCTDVCLNQFKNNFHFCLNRNFTTMAGGLCEDLKPKI